MNAALPLSAALLGIVAALLWGLHDFTARFATQTVGVRLAVAGVTVAGLAWITLLLRFSALPIPLLEGGATVGPEPLLMAALSGPMLVLATVMFFAAVARAPFARVAPIAAAFPVVVVLIAVIGGERPSTSDWWVMAMVVAGVIIVARCGSEGSEGLLGVPPRSDRLTLLLAIGTCLAFGGAVSSGHAAAAALGELEAAWLARLFGVACLPVLLLLPAGSGRLPRSGGQPAPWRWYAILVVMGALDAGAMTAVVGAGTLPNSELAAVTASGFGATSVLIAAVVLREKVSAMQWLGIAMLVAGSAMLAT